MADEMNKGPDIPRGTDEENTKIDTASPEPLRDAKIEEPNPQENEDSLYGGNPPRTNRGFTAPKFGSAGSGGAEFEPGPERD